MVVTSSTLFAVNGTVSKLILRAGLDPPRLATLRATGAALGLLLLILFTRPGPVRLRVTRRELPLLFGYGLAGFFLVPMLYFIGIGRLPVGSRCCSSTPRLCSSRCGPGSARTSG
jgi:drug/metabolite transporter (DMT)-like permease